MKPNPPQFPSLSPSVGKMYIRQGKGREKRKKQVKTPYWQGIKNKTMKYKVKVIETLEKIVEIEAANEHEAHDKAETMWFDGETTLISPDDITDHEIYIINE